MGLFFCRWDGRSSLLVEAPSELLAKVLARKVADEDEPGTGAPSFVRALVAPGGFVAELVDDGDDLHLQPLDHIVDMLADLEDEDGARVKCKSEADGPHGEALVCELDDGHDGEHEAGEVGWT